MISLSTKLHLFEIFIVGVFCKYCPINEICKRWNYSHFSVVNCTFVCESQHTPIVESTTAIFDSLMATDSVPWVANSPSFFFNWQHFCEVSNSLLIYFSYYLCCNLFVCSVSLISSHKYKCKYKYKCEYKYKYKCKYKYE